MSSRRAHEPLKPASFARLVVFSILGVCAASVPARAQQSPEGANDARNDTASKSEHGQQARASGDQEPDAEWRRQYEDNPNAEALVQGAEEAVGRGEQAEAIRLYAAALLEKRQALDPQQQTAVHERIKELAPKVARVRVRMRPSGADFKVDGEPRVLPTDAVVTLSPGHHTLEAEDGVRRAAQSLQAEAGHVYEVTIDTLNPSASSVHELEEQRVGGELNVTTSGDEIAVAPSVAQVATMWSLAAVVGGGAIGTWTWYASERGDLDRCKANVACSDTESEQIRVGASLGTASILTAMATAFLGTAAIRTIRWAQHRGGTDGDAPAASLGCGLSGRGIACTGRF